MDLLLVIFLAVTVAGLVWGVALLINRLGARDKRKLQQRLGSETPLDGGLEPSRPLLMQVKSTGLPPFLNRLAVFQRLQRWIEQGSPNGTAARFLLIELCFSVAPLALAWLITGNEVVAVLVAGVGAFVPYLLMGARRSKRQKLFSQQLPEALDFLSRVLRSGQSLSTGLQMMSEELPEPLAGEFRRCYDQHSLGQSIEDGLRGMSMRLESTDFAFFATAVIIQRQSGGDLAEVLHTISDTVRKRQRLSLSVKAKTAEGRLTGYVMVTFPVIMFIVTYFIDPTRGDVLLKTSTGHLLMGIAAGLEIFGLFLIKKITTINV